MVRAAMEGQKTQHRLVIKNQRHMDFDSGDLPYATEAQGEDAKVKCPHGVPGDRLWVREVFAIVPRTAYAHSEGVQQVIRADDPYKHDAAIYREGWTRSESCFRWRSPVIMPRWASRITLETTDVRVERLQAITDQDARAEGMRELPLQHGQSGAWWSSDPTWPKMHGRSAVDAYRAWWRYWKGPESWDANPRVWVIEFKKPLTEPPF